MGGDSLGLRDITQIQAVLRNRKTSAAPGGGNQLLGSDEPSPETKWIITAAAAVNFTGTRGDIYLEVVTGGGTSFVSGSAAPAVRVGHVHTGFLVLNPLTVLRANFLGTTAGDVLELNCHGWVVLAEE